MLLATAFLFGLTVAAAVGPIALLILNTGLAAGPLAGLRSGFGAALADLLHAAVALALGGAVAPVLLANDGALKLAAAAILTLFGIRMLWTALRPATPGTGPGMGPAAKPGALHRRPTLTTFLLTVTNPLTVLLFLGFTAHLPAEADAATAALAALAVFAGSLAGQSVFALGGAGLGRLLRDGPWITRLNVLSAAGVTLFGVAGLVG